MVSSYVLDYVHPKAYVREVTFAGDVVRLAGQIEYPVASPPDNNRYPLIFLLHHAGWNSRADYAHYARTALNCGYAVFRWDRRGTGSSGAGGRGSPVQDAVSAYEVALSQLKVNSSEVVILAQGEGTLMLGSSYGLFARTQQPRGVILAGNMLDKAAIVAINAPVHIMTGENDWNDWKQYARDAAAAHNAAYDDGAAFYVADQADRMLMQTQDGKKIFHSGAEQAMTDWLQNLCPPSQ